MLHIILIYYLINYFKYNIKVLIVKIIFEVILDQNKGMF